MYYLYLFILYVYIHPIIYTILIGGPLEVMAGVIKCIQNFSNSSTLSTPEVSDD